MGVKVVACLTSVTICLQCGDRGFPNAFVDCVKCRDASVHHYCLDAIPESFDEYIRWVCDDCEKEAQDHDHGAIPSQKRDIVLKNMRSFTNIEKKKNDSLVVQTEKYVYKDGLEQSYDACKRLDLVGHSEPACVGILMQSGGKNDKPAIVLLAEERKRCQQSSSEQLEEEKDIGSMMQHSKLSDDVRFSSIRLEEGLMFRPCAPSNDSIEREGKLWGLNASSEVQQEAHEEDTEDQFAYSTAGTTYTPSTSGVEESPSSSYRHQEDASDHFTDKEQAVEDEGRTRLVRVGRGQNPNYWILREPAPGVPIVIDTSPSFESCFGSDIRHKRRKTKRKQIVTYTSEMRETKKVKLCATEDTNIDNAIEDVGKKMPGYKSTVEAVAKLLKTFRITPHHKESLKKTPFYHMINSLRKRRSSEFKLRKSDLTSLAIIQTYSKKHKAFNLAGKYVQITENDVKIIFGVVSGSEIIEMDRNFDRVTSDFVARRFNGCKYITRTKIKDEILKVVDGNTQTEYDDLARLLTLYLCVTLFFPNSGDVLSWSYIKFVEDMEKINSYNWTKAIRDGLMNSIGKKFTDPTKVVGCVALLSYWFYEHTRGTNLKPAKKDAFPRFLKWKMPKLPSKSNNFKKIVIDSLKEFQVIEGELQPSVIETEAFDRIGDALNVEPYVGLQLDSSAENTLSEYSCSDADQDELRYHNTEEEGVSETSERVLTASEKQTGCGKNNMTIITVERMVNDEIFPETIRYSRRRSGEVSNFKKIVEENQKLDEENKERMKEIKRLKDDIYELEKDIKRLTKKSEDLSVLVVNKDGHIVALDLHIKELQATLAETNDRVMNERMVASRNTEFEGLLDAANKQLSELNASLEKKHEEFEKLELTSTAQINNLELLLAQKDEKIALLEKTAEALQNQNSYLARTLIKQKDDQIALLEKTVKTMEDLVHLRQKLQHKRGAEKE